MVINKHLGVSLTPGSFGKTITATSSLGSSLGPMTSTVKSFGQACSARNEFPPVKQAYIISGKQLVTPVIVMPLLHQRAHPAWKVCIILYGVHSQVKPFDDFSPPSGYTISYHTTKASQQRGLQRKSILISLYPTIIMLSCRVYICYFVYLYEVQEPHERKHVSF